MTISITLTFIYCGDFVDSSLMLFAWRLFNFFLFFVLFNIHFNNVFGRRKIWRKFILWRILHRMFVNHTNDFIKFASGGSVNKMWSKINKIGLRLDWSRLAGGWVVSNCRKDTESLRQTIFVFDFTKVKSDSMYVPCASKSPWKSLEEISRRMDENLMQ